MICPRCQEGGFFEGHPYNFSKMGQVKKRCKKCDHKFEVKNDFYQDPYYVSYVLGLVLFIAVLVLNIIFRDEIGPESLRVSFVAALFFLVPLIYALLKIISANFLINYEKNLSSKSLIPLDNDSRA